MQLTRISGLGLTKRVHVPWSATIGWAYSFGPRDYNAPWVNPRDQTNDFVEGFEGNVQAQRPIACLLQESQRLRNSDGLMPELVTRNQEDLPWPAQSRRCVLVHRWPHRRLTFLLPLAPCLSLLAPSP